MKETLQKSDQGTRFMFSAPFFSLYTASLLFTLHLFFPQS